MNIEASLVHQILTTERRVAKVSSDIVATRLERAGWLRSVAGEKDFSLAVSAITDAVNSGRGLLISGAAGVGKTALAKAMVMFFRHEHSFLYCKDPKHIGWMRRSREFYYNRDVILDDIGVEDIIHEYGNVIDVVGDFIQMYHLNGRGMFVATTNLHSARVDGVDGINEKYGGRVLSRLLEMCVVLKLSGQDKRERKVYA